jgi:hypothetical protein
MAEKKSNQKKKIYERLCIRQFSTSSSSSSSSKKKNLIRETKESKRKQKKTWQRGSDSPLRFTVTVSVQIHHRFREVSTLDKQKRKRKNLLNIHRQISPSVP